MSVSGRCGALGGFCPSGPKAHHKCLLPHKRAAGNYHAQHECQYCGEVFA